MKVNEELESIDFLKRVKKNYSTCEVCHHKFYDKVNECLTYSSICDSCFKKFYQLIEFEYKYYGGITEQSFHYFRELVQKEKTLFKTLKVKKKKLKKDKQRKRYLIENINDFGRRSNVKKEKNKVY